jgi:hypothetical protein
MSWWLEYFNISEFYKNGKDGLQRRRLGHTIHLPTFHQGNGIHQLLKRWSMQLVFFLNSPMIHSLTLTPTIDNVIGSILGLDTTIEVGEVDPMA